MIRHDLSGDYFGGRPPPFNVARVVTEAIGTSLNGPLSETSTKLGCSQESMIVSVPGWLNLFARNILRRPHVIYNRLSSRSAPKALSFQGSKRSDIKVPGSILELFNACNT